jgi:hypothetical protein
VHRHSGDDDLPKESEVEVLTREMNRMQLEMKQYMDSQAEFKKEMFHAERIRCGCASNGCTGNCKCKRYSVEMGTFVECDEECLCNEGGCRRNEQKETIKIKATQKKILLHKKLKA